MGMCPQVTQVNTTQQHLDKLLRKGQESPTEHTCCTLTPASLKLRQLRLLLKILVHPPQLSRHRPVSISTRLSAGSFPSYAAQQRQRWTRGYRRSCSSAHKALTHWDSLKLKLGQERWPSTCCSCRGRLALSCCHPSPCSQEWPRQLQEGSSPTQI